MHYILFYTIPHHNIYNKALVDTNAITTMITFSQANIESLNAQDFESLQALAAKAGATIGNGFDVEAYLYRIEAKNQEEAEATKRLEQTFI